MPVNYRREGRPADLGRGANAVALVDQLDRLGIDVPEEVQAARALAGQLEDRRKNLTREHRQVAVEKLLENPKADINKTTAAEVDADVQANVLLEAADRARDLVVSALTSNADAIVASVRTVLFAPAVATLEQAAATNPTATVASLLRDGDTDGAKALADAPSAAEQVKNAYGLRGLLYARGIDDLVCARWRNPDDIDRQQLADLTGPDWWVAAFRQGGQPWLPTYTEAHDASREAEQAREEERRAAAAQVDAAVKDAVRARRVISAR